MPVVCQKCGNSNWNNALPSIMVPPADSPGASHRAGLLTAIAEIDMEIARFEIYSATYISKLAEQRAEVEARLRYPVLSLPTEITSRIFLHCLPSDGGVRPSNRRVPLLLLLVCRQWKETALSIGDLWSSLEVEIHANQIMPSRVMLFRVNTWLARAPARPLSLKFGRGDSFERSGQIGDGVSEAELDIPAILPRLRRLEVNLSPGRWQPIPSNEPLPQLQCLHITLRDADLEAILKNAPLLEKLSWKRSTRGDLDFRWFTSQTLKKLDINYDAFSAADFIGILHNFPSLSDLSCYVDPRDIAHCTRSTFPNLLSLCLRHARWDSVPSIRVLDLLTLPHLGVLKSSSPNPTIILPFLSRSTCIIRELRCEIQERDVVDLWEGLEMFPSVETLALAFKIRELKIVDLLQLMDTKGALLNLGYIMITCDSDAFDGFPSYRAIIDFARRRRTNEHTAVLKSFHLVISEPHWNWHPDDVIAGELRGLISEGLDFLIHIGWEDMVWPARAAGSTASTCWHSK